MSERRLLGLAGNHEVHGGEEVLAATSNEAVGGQRQAVGRLLGAGGSEAEGLHEAGETVGEGAAPVRHAGDGEDVTDGLDVAHLARQGPVPGVGVGAVGKILVVQHLEAGGLHGVEGLGDLAHVGDAVALLDAEADLAVVQVVVVVLVGHEPLVDAKDAAGLEDAEDLAVDALERGGVDGSLDGVDGVERVVGEAHLHEVALDVVELVGQALLGGVGGGALNLVVVVVEAGNVAAGELGNLAGRAADAAADVENLHALLDADAVSQVVLVAGNGLVEGLALGETAEVEGLAPAVLVQVGGQVVVVSGEGSVLGGAGLKRRLVGSLKESNWHCCQHSRGGLTYSALLGGLVLGGLVVPVLEVLVDSSLLSITTLGEHGTDATLGLGRLAVHGLVEGSIAGVILALEVRGNGSVGRRGHVE